MQELYSQNLIEEKTFDQIVFPYQIDSPVISSDGGNIGATATEITIPLIKIPDNSSIYYPKIYGGIFYGASFKTSDTGARLEIFPQYDKNIGIVVYDNQATPAEVFKIIIDGTDVGDISIGNYTGGQGLLYDKSTGLFDFKGGVSASSISIGTSPNWFKVDTSGNVWLGQDTLVNAQANTIAFLNTGVAYLRNLVISGLQAGSSLSSSYLSGTIGQTNLNVANRGWTQTSAFSITDADTIAWGAGTFTSADGTAYSIGAGNTGNMSAKTYIYLNTAVSTTAYQTTTTSTTALGVGKVLVAIAQNGTTEATYQVLQGQGGYNIDAVNIVAGSITANEIAATTITAGLMNVSTLSSIVANLGTITAGNITLDSSGFIRSGATGYMTGIGFWLGYDTSGSTIVDSYSEPNQDGERTLGVGTNKVGQSFTGIAGVLSQAKLLLKTTLNSSGIAYVKIYAHTGTYGTSSVPTGSALATSDGFNMSNLITSYQLFTFTFSGANQINLSNGTRYCVVIEFVEEGNGEVKVGLDQSSPTHLGNEFYYYITTWYADSGLDCCFYVYIGDGSSANYKLHIGNPAGNYLTWNGSALAIRGSLNADDIIAGTLTGRTIRTASSGARVQIDSANYFQAYDASYLRVKIDTTSIKFYASTGGLTGSIIGTVDGLDLPNLFPSGNWDIGGEYGNTLAGDWRVGDSLIPSTNNIQSLGDSTHKFNTVYRTNEVSCNLPTSNSAIDIFKKIKKPKIMVGDYGERHYFEVDKFPDEMKFLNDKKEDDIELTRTLGVTVQVVRELMEKVEKLESKVK